MENKRLILCLGVAFVWIMFWMISVHSKFLIPGHQTLKRSANLSHASEEVHKVKPTQPNEQTHPVEQETRFARKYPTYDQRCYEYLLTNLTAKNVCCKMKNYSDSVELVHKCIKKANIEIMGNET